jgi:hypothetical protein
MPVLVTPGGFERYFAALAAAVRRAGGLPPTDQLVALGWPTAACRPEPAADSA